VTATQNHHTRYQGGGRAVSGPHSTLSARDRGHDLGGVLDSSGRRMEEAVQWLERYYRQGVIGHEDAVDGTVSLQVLRFVVPTVARCHCTSSGATCRRGGASAPVQIFNLRRTQWSRKIERAARWFGSDMSLIIQCKKHRLAELERLAVRRLRVHGF
jgi:hypothetical protein